MKLRRKKGNRLPPVPDPNVHPLKFMWLQFRWRVSVATVLYPVQLALAVALAVCAIPVYLVIDYQKQLHDAQQKTDELARANSRAIRDLKALTLRVVKIEKPTASELRVGISRALRRCAKDPQCKRAFVRFQIKIARTAGGRGGGSTAPGRSPKTGGGGRMPGRTTHHHTPTPTPVPRPPDHPPQHVQRPPPSPQPPTQPHPPIHIVTPPVPGVPTPTVCAPPLVGVNCP